MTKSGFCLIALLVGDVIIPNCLGPDTSVIAKCNDLNAGYYKRMDAGLNLEGIFDVFDLD